MAREFMKDVDVESAIKTVLATVAMDPRIALAVFSHLRATPMVFPWEDTAKGARRMCVHHLGWEVAAAHRMDDGFIGFFNKNKQHFDSLEDAKKGLDSLLVEAGWVLVP